MEKVRKFTKAKFVVSTCPLFNLLNFLLSVIAYLYILPRILAYYSKRLEEHLIPKKTNLI